MDNIAVCHVELNHVNIGVARVLKDTLARYRGVCKYIGEVVDKEWDVLSQCKNAKGQLTCVEKLIHHTKQNPVPKYADFDTLFYKYPSYYRRSAINFVVGAVSSYRTRLEDYNERRYNAISNGKRFREKAPKLQLETGACPTLYRKSTFQDDGETIQIKVHIRNTWDWIQVSMPMRDRKSLNEKISAAEKVSAPTLEYEYHKFYLVFPVQYGFVKFPDTPLQEQKILAVDLGINNAAVCSVMDYNGTILAREFSPFTCEKDHLDHTINRIRRVQRKSGIGQELSAIYTKLEGQKDNYVKQVCHWICSLALKYHVYGVVIEHLGKMKGRWRKDRIHHWCKAKIRDMLKGMLLRHGIRTFQINPKNTSALAFDGSGQVIRDKNNFSMCTFAKTGKRYHCDLSASYNIGARYFLRAIEKSMSEKAWSELTAKVPEFPKRTSYTLATLRAVSAIV